MRMFKDFKIGNLQLKNRVVMAPMCMYASDDSGLANSFHKTHYVSRAIGGVGLIIVEASSVAKNGRISSKDLGLWNDSQIANLREIVDEIHSYDSKACIQLSHAGRKSASGDMDLVAPSPLKYSDKDILPRELSKSDIDQIIEEFTQAALRAYKAGFDMIEIHGAHGYLIHQFLSPLSNERLDAYGASTENRSRFLREILGSIRKELPINFPISLRISADDYLDGGIDLKEIIKIIDIVKPYIDIVHVSSGGLLNTPLEVYPGYQVKYSEEIKLQLNIPTIAVGLINNPTQIEGILGASRANLVALGRKLLRDPYFVVNTAYENNIDINYVENYKRAYK